MTINTKQIHGRHQGDTHCATVPKSRWSPFQCIKQEVSPFKASFVTLFSPFEKEPEESLLGLNAIHLRAGNSKSSLSFPNATHYCLQCVPNNKKLIFAT